MHVYISGGAKNGKSYFAQRTAQALAAGVRPEDLFKGNPAGGHGARFPGGPEAAGALKRPLYYIATMMPTDEEDLARIARHLREREGWGFRTIEQSHHIEEVPAKADPDGVFLLDSVTALLANEMFASREPFTDGGLDSDAPVRVADQLVRFLEETKDAVLVSDYIYGGGASYDEWTRAYMEGLAYIDKTVAVACDQVIEVAAGQIMEYK